MKNEWIKYICIVLAIGAGLIILLLPIVVLWDILVLSPEVIGNVLLVGLIMFVPSLCFFGGKTVKLCVLCTITAGLSHIVSPFLGIDPGFGMAILLMAILVMLMQDKIKSDTEKS